MPLVGGPSHIEILERPGPTLSVKLSSASIPGSITPYSPFGGRRLSRGATANILTESFDRTGLKWGAFWVNSMELSIFGLAVRNRSRNRACLLELDVT